MKKKILILILSILALTLCVTACTPDDIEGANVKSIEVVTGSVPTECFVGETLDFSQIKITITYTDDTTKEVGYSDVTLSSVDTSTAGEKEVTVTYGEASTSFTVTVKEEAAAATLTEIKIVAGSIPVSYYLKQTPDLSGIQVVGIYSDGSEKLIPTEDIELTAIDTSVAGEQDFTVKYQGLSNTVKITVFDIVSMKVISGTVASKIFVGQELDVSQLQIIVKYSNDQEEIVEAKDLVITELDTATYGKKNIEITYKGVKIEQQIEVVGAVSLTVNPGSYATSVKVNGTLDVSKITAYITYSDETKETVATADLTVKNFDTATAGTKKLEISYGDLSTSVDVTVVGVDTLTVVSGVANEILKGAAFNIDDINVSVKYTDGTTEFVGKSALTLGSIDVNTAGEQKLTIAYLDGAAEYTVKVCEIVGIRVEGVNKVVQAGDDIVLDGMTVYGTYNDSGHTEIVLTDGITTNIDDIDVNSEEDKELVVSYNGEYGEFSATVKITTTPPELVDIRVTHSIQFIELGGTYDYNTINVWAIYGNETEDKITANISRIDTSVAGAATITVSYTEGGVTKEKTVEVQVLPIVKLEVSGLATVVDKGGVYDTSSVRVLATFSDGTNTITREVGIADGVIVSTPDTSWDGSADGFNKTVTITYKGFSATHAYKVKAVNGITIFSGLNDTLRKGYAVDINKLVIEISYTTEVTEQKTAAELAELGAAMTGTEVDSTKFTVSYEGYTVERELTIIRPVSVSALNNTVPSTVLQGASVLYENIKLSVTYDNGEVYLVGINEPNGPKLTLTPENFDTSITGIVAIVFEYDGFSTSANVEVKGVDKVELVGGILTTVNVGQKVDTSDILVKVLYSDGTLFYADRNSPHLEIESIDTSTAGEKELVVKYQGVACKTTEGKPIMINIVEVKVEGLIFGAYLPDNLVARESYKKNFKNSDRAYVVGDDNPFYFYLNVIILDENDEVVEVDGKTVPTVATIYEVKNGVAEDTPLSGDSLAAVVAFDSATNSYDFTEAAIGRSFKLVIRPRDEASYLDEAAVTKSYTVTVVDGYNIYDAKELNILTNYDSDINGSVEGELNQSEVVDKFLKEHGIVRPENLKGIVLHGNLELDQDDLPSEYYYEYTKDGVTKVGMYDDLKVFDHRFTTDNPTMTVYGNYYSIYSYNLPPVIEKGYANNTDDFSSSVLFSFKIHPEKEYHKYPNGTLDTSRYQANIQDLAMRDNDPNSNDQSASERHMRGLTALRVGVCHATFDNVNVDAYMTSLSTEDDMTTVNLKQVKFYNAWQTHLFLWSNNQYQDYVSNEKTDAPFANVYGQKVIITDSLVAKCGGPVIIAQSVNRDWTVNRNSGHDVVVDDKSVLYSYVTGQEAWFVAVGQTQLAAQIMAMDTLISNTNYSGIAASYISNKHIANVNTVNMIMLNMGTGTTLNPSEQYSGSFTRINADGTKTVALNMAASYDTSREQNKLLNDYKTGTGGAAPIFQSSGGGIAFTDGTTGCYSLPATAPGLPENKFYEGEYITLYYSGVGIMLEYYHDAPKN